MTAVHVCLSCENGEIRNGRCVACEERPVVSPAVLRCPEDDMGAAIWHAEHAVLYLRESVRRDSATARYLARNQLEAALRRLTAAEAAEVRT